jgi:thiosulfate dehydrogenase [quinone] large subunit
MPPTCVRGHGLDLKAGHAVMGPLGPALGDPRHGPLRRPGDDDGIELDDRYAKATGAPDSSGRNFIMGKAKGLAALRILLGAGFLYAGLEKVFDFTASGKAFTSAGFLQFGTGGTLPGSDPKAIVNPTHDLWVSLAGNPGLVSMINWLVVAGELTIGIALILGIATRFAGVAGALLMGFITIAAWDFAFGPVNETVLYTVVALYLAYAQAGLVYGLDSIIEKTEIVAHRPALHYLLG